MNLPNKLTIIRILLVPVYVGLMYFDNPVSYWAASFVFAAACLTDFLDGMIARKTNQISTFGKLMDPIADKLLVMSALVLLTFQHKMPAWVTIIMLAREFIISGFRLVAIGEGKIISADIFGKIKTVIQMLFIMLAMLLLPVANGYQPLGQNGALIVSIVMYISLGITLLSGILYVWKNRNLLKDS